MRLALGVWYPCKVRVLNPQINLVKSWNKRKTAQSLSCWACGQCFSSGTGQAGHAALVWSFVCWLCHNSSNSHWKQLSPVLLSVNHRDYRGWHLSWRCWSWDPIGSPLFDQRQPSAPCSWGLHVWERSLLCNCLPLTL